MPTRGSEINPGKAGPKGALAEKPKSDTPSSGPAGNEDQNTRRDFVRLKKGKKGQRGQR